MCGTEPAHRWASAMLDRSALAEATACGCIPFKSVKQVTVCWDCAGPYCCGRGSLCQPVGCASALPHALHALPSQTQQDASSYLDILLSTACSHTGHDFRPDYKGLSVFKRRCVRRTACILLPLSHDGKYQTASEGAPVMLTPCKPVIGPLHLQCACSEGAAEHGAWAACTGTPRCLFWR